MEDPDDVMEAKIVERGLEAPRLKPGDILKKVKGVTFTRLPSGKTLICEITLENGFTVRGEGNCVSPENFNLQIG
jgi:hypothetical protein